MFGDLNADLGRLAQLRARRSVFFGISTVLFDNGFQAVLLYRLARALKRLRVPLLPAAIWRSAIFLTGADINPNAELGPGLVVSHGQALVIGGGIRVGRDCLLHHSVTLGAPTVERIGAVPTLGDRVIVGAGAQILGDVTVGDGAMIGAGSLVTFDVPENARVRAPKAELLPSSPPPGAGRSDSEAARTDEPETWQDQTEISE